MRALFNNYTLWFGTEFVNLYRDDEKKRATGRRREWFYPPLSVSLQELGTSCGAATGVAF